MQTDAGSQNDLIPDQGANGNGSGTAMQDLLSALNAAMQNGALFVSSVEQNPTCHYDPGLCVLLDLLVSCREETSSRRISRHTCKHGALCLT